MRAPKGLRFNRIGAAQHLYQVARTFLARRTFLAMRYSHESSFPGLFPLSRHGYAKQQPLGQPVKMQRMATIEPGHWSPSMQLHGGLS